MTPPVFVVVCNNTNVSKMVFDYDSDEVVVPGALGLFSEEEDGSRNVKGGGHRAPA